MWPPPQVRATRKIWEHFGARFAVIWCWNVADKSKHRVDDGIMWNIFHFLVTQILETAVNVSFKRSEWLKCKTLSVLLLQTDRTWTHQHRKTDFRACEVGPSEEHLNASLAFCYLFCLRPRSGRSLTLCVWCEVKMAAVPNVAAVNASSFKSSFTFKHYSAFWYDFFCWFHVLIALKAKKHKAH